MLSLRLRAPSLFRLSLSRFPSSCRLFSTSISGGNTALGVKPAPALLPNAIKDVIIYRFEAPRFFRNLAIFGIIQYGVWLFISYSSLGMVDAPVAGLTKEEEDELPFWRKVNLGQNYYKYGITVGSVFMGFAILFVSWMYIIKSVRYLILRKDGKTMSFVTYTPIASRNYLIDVPIKDISAAGSRTSGASQMPVKVKGRSFYYLIDVKEGKVVHPQIFDKTVGTKRNFS